MVFLHTGMANQKITPIAELKNKFAPWNIKVRVFKYWEGIDPKNGEPSGLDYIFIDEQGSRIHGKVVQSKRNKFEDKLEEGKLYILSKINVFQAELSYRPTRREFAVFLNASTTFKEVNEISGFPKFSFDFIKLSTLAERKDNVFLNDVIGVFKDSSEVKTVGENKIIREILIQDETASNVRVVLWGDMANNFVKPTNLSEKPIFILSSTTVDFYRVTQKYSVHSRASSSYYFDLDIPEVHFLKNSNFEVGGPSESIDWTTNNRKSIAEMLDAYKPNSEEAFFTCIATYSSFEGKYTYPSCSKCNRRVKKNGGGSGCQQCRPQQPITQAIVSRITISDSSGTCIVSVFGNKAVEMMNIELEELLEYEQLGVNLSDIFEQLRDKEFILEIKMKTYQDNMSLSIQKSKLIYAIPDDDPSLDGDDQTNVTPIFDLVSVKKENDDVDIQPDPQVIEDDDDDGINLTLMRKRAAQKNKRTDTTKQGDKENPTKKLHSKEN